MTLMSRFRLLDDKSRSTLAFYNPRYIPFYYYLGKYIQPKTLLHIGFGIGIESGVFLLSCPTVEKFFAIQDPMGDFYSSRIGERNVSDKYKKEFECYVGNIESASKIKDNEWDLQLITETMSYDKHRQYFDIAWDNLVYNGLMVVDNLIYHEPIKQAFVDFCTIVNREPIMIDTRNGVGIVKK